MIREKRGPHADSGVGTGFPGDKRETRLRDDYVQKDSLERDSDLAERI
jgi:hypothetical protein